MRYMAQAALSQFFFSLAPLVRRSCSIEETLNSLSTKLATRSSNMAAKEILSARKYNNVQQTFPAYLLYDLTTQTNPDAHVPFITT